MTRINLAAEGFDTPGGRYIKHGPQSGEALRKILPDGPVTIDLDGSSGGTSSFWSEALQGRKRADIQIEVTDPELDFIPSMVDRLCFKGYC